MRQCLRSQYVWWTGKNISQLARPNYSLINERMDCTEPLAKPGCHKGKTGKGLRFHDLWHFQAGTLMAGLMDDPSRHQECGYTDMPEQVFLIFHTWELAVGGATPSCPPAMLTPKAQQAHLPCMGTPLVLQQVTLVPAPAALNWHDGTEQLPWSCTKKTMGFGISEWHNGLENTLDSEYPAPRWEVKN